MVEKITARVLEAVLVKTEDFAQFEFFNSYVLFLNGGAVYLNIPTHSYSDKTY